MRAILLLGTALISALFASTARAELRCPEPAKQLGEIRGGLPLACVFTLTNAGKEPLEILEVNRGCGCLAPRLDKRRLGPGESSDLRIELRTLGQKDGPHTWRASIRYRQADMVRETPLAIHAVVRNEVVVQPAVLAMFVESTLRQEVTITDRRTPPFRVTKVAASNRAVKASVQSAGGGSTTILLEATGGGLAPGRYDEVLDIYTSDPLYAHLQVPITLVRGSTSPVHVTPEKAELRLAEPSAAALIRLRPRGDKPLFIERAEADHPALKCTWASSEAHGCVVKIQVDSKTMPGKDLKATVRVMVRDHAEPILIPVEVK